MENRFLKNKIVIKYCKDYYRIINERFNEFDPISAKVIQVYQSYIFSVDPRSKIDMKKAVSLNNAIVRYFEDRDFKKELSSSLKSLKVPKEMKNVGHYIVDFIIERHGNYMDGYTRNIYIPKWI